MLFFVWALLLAAPTGAHSLKAGCADAHEEAPVRYYVRSDSKSEWIFLTSDQKNVFKLFEHIFLKNKQFSLRNLKTSENLVDFDLLH